ncbi:MAG: glycosyltransferase [Geobacteraceae bacterium]|nr:glycosyltransferase [Geobacteraceae bacterium]
MYCWNSESGEIMKILYVTNARLCSGAEDHLLDVSLWLRDRDVEPVFIIREGGMLKERLDSYGLRYFQAFVPGRRISSIFRIARILQQELPDVVSVNREYNILPLYIAERMTSPFIKKRPKMVSVLHTPTGRWCPGIGTFDGVIATSEYTAESFFRTNRGIKEKTSLIYHGIKLPETDHEAKCQRNRLRRVFRDRQFPIIGMSGELWKNQEELVDVARFLVKVYPEITIAIIGGYEGGTALREKIDASGLGDNFILTGRLDRKLMPDVFYDLDLSVSTHRNEGFGLVHIESMAGYTPVVAYNSGGLVEILRNGGGVLVDGTTEDFAKAVIDLLGNDGKRKSIGLQGRKVVEENFSIDAMGKNHLAFYEKMLGKDRVI